MTSPFATYEEFSNVDGAMYTFANNPTVIGLLLAICLAITIYFFYASFNLRQNTDSKSSAVLGIILALVTSAGSLLPAQPTKQSPSAHRYRPSDETVNANKWQPLALLGIVGTGAGLRRKKRRSASLGRSATKRR